MNQNPTQNKRSRSALQVELDNTKTQFYRLINCWLNRIFNLSAIGSQRRGSLLLVLFLAIGFVVVLRNNPMYVWVAQLSSFFQYLLNPAYGGQSPTALNDFIKFMSQALFRPESLRYLPIFILPYLIGLHAASLYLDDIFELNRVDIAQEFIQQVALTGSRNRIRFAQGGLADRDRESPIFLIGGPGQVIVELDTAVLFEKPDGRPHVIGPNTKKEDKILEGFERFRGFKDFQSIDLRDQYCDPINVSNRSLEGIPVSAVDVRMVFSVHRPPDEKPTLRVPHPFDEKAIETLIYEQPSRVLSNGNHPSEPPVSWTGTMQGLIRGSLSAFMSRNRLPEYLSSIGPIETGAAEKREEEIVKARNMVVSDGDQPETPAEFTPPPFQPRHEVSKLFKKFTDDFSENNFTGTANKRGVDLHWVGVGTWKTPDAVAPARHIEAWKLSRENAMRGNKAAINAFKQESQIQRTIRDIQDMPLARFAYSVKMEKHKDAVQDLLIGYREQFIKAVELLKKSGRPVPDEVFKAITHIEIVIGAGHRWHWAGQASQTQGKGTSTFPSSVGPPHPGAIHTAGIPSTRPSPEDETRLFKILVETCGGDEELAEERISNERKQYPHADRKILIEHAIERLIRDRN